MAHRRGHEAISNRLPARHQVLSLFEGEADLERHLVMSDLPVRHLTSYLDDFKPLDVPHGGGGPGDRVLDGIGDAHT